ncbi:unnamed protein product [Phaeothamnion confervicola]
MKSMQKVVNCMKDLCGLDAASAFLDVGSGLGKPNFHDPGCQISYGVELEEVRWRLSIHNLRAVLYADAGTGSEKKEKAPLRQHNVIFARADITDASTFDPFTHVYTFDVGFPPATLGRMAAMFNASGARYLINYHPPKQTVDRDGFDVELVAQMHTSLTGKQ